MEGEESDWDDLPDWVRDFLDKNELTELVWDYLKSRVPYDTFKNWTFEELRAIKFRANILNRSKVSQTPLAEPDSLQFLNSLDENMQGGSKVENDREDIAEKSGKRETGYLEWATLIQDIMNHFTVVTDCSSLAPNYPDLVRIKEYRGPSLAYLRSLNTSQLRELLKSIRSKKRLF